jgi:predicted nucleotidyltransferase
MHAANDAVIEVPREIRPLIDRIRARMAPDAIWLFGSRARGDHRADSDWDILVALDDRVDPGLLDPIFGWEIQHELAIPATILLTTSSELKESWGAPNTIGYVLAREGLKLDG